MPVRMNGRYWMTDLDGQRHAGQDERQVLDDFEHARAPPGLNYRRRRLKHGVALSTVDG